jgi:hypothetical protein
MLSSLFKKSTSTAAGSLFTWGETTYGWGRALSNELRVPGQVN